MLLKVDGWELEIVDDKFVCFAAGHGDTSLFCEWKHLGPQLQERFKSMRLELLEVMRNFAVSDARRNLQSVAEEYREDKRCDNSDLTFMAACRNSAER